MPYTTNEIAAFFEGRQVTFTDTVAELYDGNRMHVATRADWRVDAWELTAKGEALVNGTPMPKTQQELHRERSLKGLQEGPKREPEPKVDPEEPPAEEADPEPEKPAKKAK